MSYLSLHERIFLIVVVVVSFYARIFLVVVVVRSEGQTKKKAKCLDQEDSWCP